MDNVSHAQAVAALKRAGKRVELTVKRKAVVKVIIIIQSMIIDMIVNRYQHQFEVADEVLLEEVDIDLDRILVIVGIEVIPLIVVDHAHDTQGPGHEQDHDLTHIQMLTVMITQTIDVLIDPGNTTIFWNFVLFIIFLDLPVPIVLDGPIDPEEHQLIQGNQLVDPVQIWPTFLHYLRTNQTK